MANESDFDETDLFRPIDNIKTIDIIYHLIRLTEGLLALIGLCFLILYFVKLFFVINPIKAYKR